LGLLTIIVKDLGSLNPIVSLAEIVLANKHRAMSANKQVPVPASVNFATAGMGGLFGWAVVHPFNTLGIRMNLATASGNAKVSFLPYLASTVKTQGFMSLYSGLGAGMLRQVFYSTSRYGFFEVFRDELAKHRPTDFLSRLLAGVTSGG
jgi:solute carrier family 25 oxoglutarate transporter 11